MLEQLEKISQMLRKEGIHNEIVGNALLVNEDCKKVLEIIPDNCIDSFAIDPAYGIGHLNKQWDNFSPEAILKGTERKDGAGISPAMFSGNYDKSLRGAICYQQWCTEWALGILRVLKPGGHITSFCSPRKYHRLTTGIEDAGFEIRDQIQWIFGGGLPFSHDVSSAIDKQLGQKREIIGPNPNRARRQNWDNNPKNITSPTSKEALEWSGWGTRLKQTNEPIVLARKPLAETNVAKNVLAWGTGGINIDECRIGEDIPIKKGRHPSNTIISEEVARALDDKAKYYYCPKISKNERNAGCDELEARTQNNAGNGRSYNDRCATCGKKFMGSENTRCQCPVGLKKTDKSVYKNKNHHPTVKPIDLMEYLVKMITPKNGICIDIFMGSGSTGLACSNLGIGFIGIEMEPEYFEVARARIRHWQQLDGVA